MNDSPTGFNSSPDRPRAALRRFALAITILNLLGHTYLGFEQSWAQPVAALATTYSLETLFEWIEARVQHRPARYSGGGIKNKVDFLLSAHITGLACAMLLFPNDRLEPIMFAAAVAIGSKVLLRVPAGRCTRHLFNPSNLGITVTLLCFPWVGIAPPYHFTENLDGVGDWLLPGIIVLSGTFLNTRFTGRLPLIICWLLGFGIQAVLRHLLLGTLLGGAFMPMTGVAFILYTFYMITDPATTPGTLRGQCFFGFAVAAVYGILMTLHIVFGLFFALTIVCAGRGLVMLTYAWWTTLHPAVSMPSYGAVSAPIVLRRLPARAPDTLAEAIIKALSRRS